MENQKNDNRRILLTAVSGVDPYTVSNEEYHDGSIMAVLRKKIKDGEPITDIYIYLSLEMAIKEFRIRTKEETTTDHALTEAINYLYESKSKTKPNIVFYPEGIVEEIERLLNKVTEEKVNNEIKLAENEEMKARGRITGQVDLNRIYTRILKKDEERKIAEVDVNKFGLFYPTYYKMFENADENAQVYVNLSSGTSAMQEDISLIALTNKKITPTIMQVSTPVRESNFKNIKQPTSSKEELTKLNELEEGKRESEKEDFERVTVEELRKTKKLMLLQSLEDSFKKHDFAGVRDAIISNKSIIENEKIIKYAENLYYRYIGDDKSALEYANSIEKSKNELYPIFDDENKNEFQKLRNLIERINIMNIKAERNEINDWLLITQTVIEALYIKLIYFICDEFDFNKIVFNNNDKNIKKSDIGKISYNKFKEYNENCQKKYDCLNDIIQDTERLNKKKNEKEYSYVNAFISKKMLKEWLDKKSNDKDIEAYITILDKIRSFRNTAAHTDTFITKDELVNGFKQKIREENEYRSRMGYDLIVNVNTDDAIETTSRIINKIVLKILNGNNPEEDAEEKFNKSINVYKTIQDKILDLLKREIGGI